MREAYGGPTGENTDVVEDGYPENREQAEGKTWGADDGAGAWLEEKDPAKVARWVLKAWSDQDARWRGEIAEGRVNDLRRRGYYNVEVVKDQDRDEYTIWQFGDVAPGLNKAATYCRKMSAILLADPPEPDPQPAGTDSVHQDQAEFSKRVLDRLLDEGELDGLAALWEAEDLASTWRRAYIVFWVDPKGSRIPLEVEAHPQAIHAEQPLQGPPQGIDPFTGAEIPGPLLDPSEAVLRFVRMDGTLTDKQEEAAWTWAPQIRREVVDGRHVRHLPAAAETLADAYGVLIASFVPVGELKRRYPEAMQGLTEEDLDALAKCGDKARFLLPGDTKKEREALLALKGDDRLIFTVRATLKAHADHPKGAQCVAAGSEGKPVLLDRRPWVAEMPGVGEEPLDLPVAELRQWRKECVMDIAGPPNEMRGQTIGAIFDHTDQVLNRHLFMPIGSNVTEHDLQNRVINFNPAGKPEWEGVDPLDGGVMATFEMLKQEMQEDLGLGGVGQDLVGPSSGDSGRAKFAVIGQAQVALSEPRFWLARCYVQMCRTILQHVRAFYTVPQRLRFVSPDGGYKERRWRGADLGGTRDVKLKAGTLSMMSPALKTEQIVRLTQAGVQIPPDMLIEIVAGNLDTLQAVAEDPHKNRVRRQIAEWTEGPPTGWQPLPPQQVVTGVDPVTGQPMVQNQPQIDPVLAEMWAPTLADSLPHVAQMRMVEIGKAMAGERYQSFPPEWRMGLDMAFQSAAAVLQQQAAAAQQQQAATQATAKKPGTPDERAQQKTQQAVATAGGAYS